MIGGLVLVGWLSHDHASSTVFGSNTSVFIRQTVNVVGVSRRVETFAYYSDCSAARAAGVQAIRAGEPGYRPELDLDGDGVACEPWW